MKKFSLLILSVLLLSCSSNSNDEIVDPEGNFLDVYNGVIWKNDNDLSNDGYWIVFTPISFGEAEGGVNCRLSSDKWGVDNGDGNGVIKENSKNLLKWDYVLPNGEIEHSYTVTTSQNGNVLNFSVGGGTITFDRVTTKPCE